MRTWRIGAGRRALMTRSGGRADEAERAQTVEQTGGRAKVAQMGPRRHGQGPTGADGRTGGLGGPGLHCTDGGSGRQTDGWTGQSEAEEPRSGGLAVGQRGRRAGGLGFKRLHSTRPISLLGAQSACLVRARVRRVPESAVGSSRIPCQTPVLSAWTFLPLLSASVLGAEKGILLSAFRK